MVPPSKYQPYQGYGTTQPFAYVWPPKRLRTRSDWRIPHERPGYYEEMGQLYEPWKRWPKRSDASVYEKAHVHRIFRRRTRDAIRRELDGDEGVSHHFIVSGDYLD